MGPDLGGGGGGEGASTFKCIVLLSPPKFCLFGKYSYQS